MAVEITESHPPRHSAVTNQQNLDQAPCSATGLTLVMLASGPDTGGRFQADAADCVLLLTAYSVNRFDPLINLFANEDPVHASIGHAYKGTCCQIKNLQVGVCVKD